MRTTTRTNAGTTGTRILLVTLVSALALVAAGRAAASPATSFQPTNNCWKDVINDWLAHQPNVVNLYPIPCYTQAIQHLSAYSDVQAYSSAMDDIHRALLGALLEERGIGPGNGSTGGSSPGGGAGTGGSTPPGSGGTSSSNQGPITKLFDSVAPGNATSVPLPLLVLGALAGLLLLAAAGTWGARRIQSRKMTPAPQPATSPSTGPSPKP